MAYQEQLNLDLGQFCLGIELALRWTLLACS